MHQRILIWVFLCAFFAVGSLRAQAPAAGEPAVKGGAEAIVVARLKGTVTKTLPGQAAVQVKVGDAVETKAKINTAQNSSVVLVFSNGTTTNLEADSELIIEEFLQDPFDQALQVATATKEPSRSTTRLALNRGELVGDVKELNYNAGSTFKVVTPVGAAGIRGTIFRIVFRPSGSGQAFFTLSTAQGRVEFETPGAGGAGGTGATVSPGVQGAGIVTGVDVPQGQEIVIPVNVEVNPQGQVVVTPVATPNQASTISPANMQAAVAVAQDIAVVAQAVTFTPTAAPSTPQGTPGGGGSSGGATPPAGGQGGGGTGGTGGTGGGGTTGGGGGSSNPTGTQVTITSPTGTTTTTTVINTQSNTGRTTTSTVTTSSATNPTGTTTTTSSFTTTTNTGTSISGQIQQQTPPVQTPPVQTPPVQTPPPAQPPRIIPTTP